MIDSLGLNLLGFVAGLILLTFAADRFVLGAARLSTAMNVSPVLIGAIVIGFGTSAPELLVTTLATLSGSQDLAFGNVVGSNSANLLLVLGAAALIRPIVVGVGTLRREVPLTAISMALLVAATFNGRVTTVDATMLLLGAVVVIGVIVRTGLRDREAAAALEAEVAEYEGSGSVSVPRAALLSLAGLVGTLAGAQVLVVSATGLARTLGVSEAVIGLTVVAVGTSLPELVTALAAARRGDTDLIVGNVLGSNIFNSLPVAGVAGMLATVQLDPAFGVSLAVMAAAMLLAALLLRSGQRLTRSEGGVLLVGFVMASVLVL